VIEEVKEEVKQIQESDKNVKVEEKPVKGSVLEARRKGASSDKKWAPTKKSLTQQTSPQRQKIEVSKGQEK